jgi:hypothetical protein
MDIYIYIEKKKVYNIEGQLRGLQGSGHPKACAPQCVVVKLIITHTVRRVSRVRNSFQA